MKRIVADVRKCMACRACEIACAVSHVEGEDLVGAISSGRARKRVYVEAAGCLAVPLQCRHCEDAPCVKVCPSGALSRLSPGAPVLVQEERCIGCEFCVQACPFGVIRLATVASSDGTTSRRAVVKCDLCVARQAKGMKPACVSACPTGAIEFREADDSARDARRRTACEEAAAVERGTEKA